MPAANNSGKNKMYAAGGGGGGSVDDDGDDGDSDDNGGSVALRLEGAVRCVLVAWMVEMASRPTSVAVSKPRPNKMPIKYIFQLLSTVRRSGANTRRNKLMYLPSCGCDESDEHGRGGGGEHGGGWPSSENVVFEWEVGSS